MAPTSPTRSSPRPTVILLSAVASLVGAGAHLVTAEILEQTGNETISYGRWPLLGAPFALVSAFGSSWAIQRLFLSREERRRPLTVTAADLRETDDPDTPTGTGTLTWPRQRNARRPTRRTDARRAPTGPPSRVPGPRPA